ncbi:hypothetical protein TPE_2603 [Treponema pedis str. T A4]|uniref:Uncharacterized protein n=1 Tax=Treponema pedis str. T A4 TaxID=1291379 RepID=S5ZX98_9SPIR|nr:hypothetical protein TPE_2603 [Treponema pedis str. T A4]
MSSAILGTVSKFPISFSLIIFEILLFAVIIYYNCVFFNSDMCLYLKSILMIKREEREKKIFKTQKNTEY